VRVDQSTITATVAMRAIRPIAVAILVAALVAVGFRGYDSTALTIDGDVPAGQTTTTSVPPPSAAAPAPLPQPSAVPDTPPATQVRDAPDTDADADDADAPLVLQDPASTRTDDARPAPARVAPSTRMGSGQGDTPRARFASRFPAHDAATQDAMQPSTTRWAVLVGVNDHHGTVRNNVGSRQDAESLYTHLMDLGWNPDHVLLLTDRLATRETVIEALRWLERKTTDDSVALFWYSGHAKRWSGVDVDGDGHANRIGLWPSDNRFVTDREFIRLLSGIRAHRLWVNIMACHAEQFLQDGLARDGRVVTFSSRSPEKSYEDPSVDHSVWGWNLVVRGLRQGLADSNGDGDVTVQEALNHAIPRAAHRTSRQTPYGPQNGLMVDRAGGPFSLAIPAPPEPDADPEPAEQPSERDERRCVLVLCSNDQAIRD
jgi:hypothetical protein